MKLFHCYSQMHDNYLSHLHGPFIPLIEHQYFIVLPRNTSYLTFLLHLILTAWYFRTWKFGFLLRLRLVSVGLRQHWCLISDTKSHQWLSFWKCGEVNRTVELLRSFSWLQLDMATKSRFERNWHNTLHFVHWCRYGETPQEARMRQVNYNYKTHMTSIFKLRLVWLKCVVIV